MVTFCVYYQLICLIENRIPSKHYEVVKQGTRVWTAFQCITLWTRISLKNIGVTYVIILLGHILKPTRIVLPSEGLWRNL